MPYRNPSKSKRTPHRYLAPKVMVGVFFLMTFGFVSAATLMTAENPAPATVVLATEDPNFHVRHITTQFFEDNGAPEMIPIIACESNFRQFDEAGQPLKNHEGSSAIGVAQILSSKHPDTKVIARYNEQFDMDMSIEDFDLTSLEGNLGYALVLYKVRGTRDWECGERFGF